MIKRIGRYCLMCLSVLLVQCGYQKKAKTIPLEVFFQNPVKTSFRISPDGNYISFLQPYANRLNIYVQARNGKPVRLTHEKEFNVASYFWVNNDKLFYTKNSVDKRVTQLFSVERANGNVTDLLPAGNFKVLFLNQSRVINNELLLAINMRDSSVFDVYRLNVNTCSLRLAAENPGNIVDWLADSKGQIRVARASDGVNETLLFRNSENEAFRPVLSNNFQTRIEPIGFCEKRADCIFALSSKNRDKAALVELNCSTGKEEKVIFKHQDVDVTGASYSQKNGKLVYATYETWKKQRFYLDDTLKHLYQDIEKLLPGNEVSIVSTDSAQKQLIVRTFTDKTPGAYYCYTPANKKLVKLGDINPNLPAEEMCAMKPVSYKSRDGITINGYLTLPKGSKTKNFPVVVIPHSWPHNRNSWEYNAEVQFLANRGYAVFQVNYRGSKGYGKQFWAAGFKQWGSKMQTDITDGVNWLIENKIANPKRIAIYGAGFGGYSALWGATFEPGLYRCAASYSGILNLFTFIKSIPPYYRTSLKMYYEIVGNPEKDMDYFRAVSPVFHTDKIRVPLLIAQGGKDPRVNISEANQFVKEAKKRDIPVIYLVKDEEGIYFVKPENREEFYRNLEKFLADNLGK
ncbi:S9 family peptidase [Pedobacter sp. BS3]|uniref:S9 family peptidase n=1 Tax=Pedobacter sp. BS3 TaxID=2567937 RepID=UPI0011EFFB92|nr:S9 family peptidase [Pedobacter sp. BS3]TZF82263.1 S9 family peptidase [Pedobacter sp. BS3]